MKRDNVWQVNQLRFTFFVDMTDREVWANVFQQFTGNEPDERSEKVSALLRTESGMWNDQKLTVTLFHDRVNIIWHSPETEAAGLPKVGKFTEVVDTFLNGMQSVINDPQRSTIHRVAFGAMLLAPVSSHEDAYRALAEYLPAVKIDPLSKDFFYQINRPIASQVDHGVLINRLSKWAAVRTQYIQLDSNGTQLSPLTEFACYLELDISGAVETPYSDEVRISSRGLSEMVGIAKTLAAEGDQV